MIWLQCCHGLRMIWLYCWALGVTHEMGHIRQSQERAEYRRKIERLSELLDNGKLLRSSGGALAACQAHSNSMLSRGEANAELVTRLTAASQVTAWGCTVGTSWLETLSLLATGACGYGHACQRDCLPLCMHFRPVAVSCFDSVTMTCSARRSRCRALCGRGSWSMWTARRSRMVSPQPSPSLRTPSPLPPRLQLAVVAAAALAAPVLRVARRLEPRKQRLSPRLA